MVVEGFSLVYVVIQNTFNEMFVVVPLWVRIGTRSRFLKERPRAMHRYDPVRVKPLGYTEVVYSDGIIVRR